MATWLSNEPNSYFKYTLIMITFKQSKQQALLVENQFKKFIL